MRALTVRAESIVLGWRTWWGRSTATRHLDALAAALRPKGYRCVALYRAGRRYLCPCGDAEGAAELVDHVLARRMSPATR